MLEPSPPLLESFDLNEELVLNLPKQIFSEKNFKRNISYFVTLCVIVLFSIFSNAKFNTGEIPSFTSTIFGALVDGVIFGGLIGTIIIELLSGMEKRLLIATNSNLKKYKEYLEACSLYQKEKREYELFIAKQKEDYWKSLSGKDFEIELGKLFKLSGYNVRYTPSTGDGGVDLILTKGDKITIVQCKAHNKRIPIGVARELCASINDFHANDAIIACIHGVTAPVSDYIKNKPITVMDVKAIVNLQKKLADK